MTQYHVTWEIDVIADSPREAAQIALEMQRDRDSIATCFDVREFDTPGCSVAVDLLEDDN